MVEPAPRKDDTTPDAEKRGVDFDINRRLSDHLMANAIRPGDGAPDLSRVQADKGWVAASLALVPLLIAAWLYSLLVDRAER